MASSTRVSTGTFLRLLMIVAVAMVAAVHALPAKTRFRSQAQESSSSSSLTPVSMQLKQKVFLDSIEGNYKAIIADVKESRTRRSVDNREVGQIDVRIELNGALVDLVLHENVDLHASSATHCHFIGHVKGREDWTAALSTCLGLSGFVQYDGETYVVESLLDDNGEHMPHSAVYKSSHRKVGDCAAMDTTSSVKHKDANTDSATSDKATANSPQAVEQMSATMTRPLGVKRRAAATPRYIELAVVLDQLAVGLYGANAQTYVLTIINQVAALFRNGNFDYDMVFQVVTIRSIANNNAAGFTSGSTSVLLNAMSALQSSMGVSNDVAALIYGGDIFQGSSSSVAGIANVGVVCRNRAASVSASEEDGLFATALIMAHELGHNFNLQHDSASCLTTETNTQGIMAASSGPSASAFYWSTCSRNTFNAFVAASTCLSNSAPNALPMPSALPGTTISMDKQCQLQYGPSSSFCTWCYGGSEPSACSRLWCNMDGGSAGTHYSGLLEGTTCPIGNSFSNGMGVCNKGACVSASATTSTSTSTTTRATTASATTSTTTASTTTRTTTTTTTTTTTKATTTAATTTKATTASTTTTRSTTTSSTTTSSTTTSTATTTRSTTAATTSASAALNANLLRNGDFDTCSTNNLPDGWTLTDIKNGGDTADLGCQGASRGVDGGRWLNGGQSSRFSQQVVAATVPGTTYSVRVSVSRASAITAIASISLSASLDGNGAFVTRNVGVVSTLWATVELQYKATSSGPLFLHLASLGNMAGSVVGWDKAQVTATSR